ncbi:MAG: hypothetical protein ACFFCM_11395 [Promethearchaeota archaeon]
MVKREKFLIIIVGFLLFTFLFSNIIYNSDVEYTEYSDSKENLESSVNLEGIENVVITRLIRIANISGYGLLSIEDELTILNLNSNPISSFLFGIPIDASEDLIFLEASGEDKNTLLIERPSMIMDEYEIVVAYFDSPLLPHQKRIITFTHIYTELLTYTMAEDELIILSTTVYPLIPYKMKTDEIFCVYNYPESAISVEGGWGFVNPTFYHVSFGFELLQNDLTIDYISPFLENLGEYRSAIIFFTISDAEPSTPWITKLEMDEVNREFLISPWGIIKVREEFTLTNVGIIEINQFSIKIPKNVKNLRIYDYLGDITGVDIEQKPNSQYQILTFDLFESNRIRIMQNSTFKFNLEYYLPFENHVSVNWLQQSIQINLLPSTFEYLSKKQNIDLIIDGCYKINTISDTPEAIKATKNFKTLNYKLDYITPNDEKVIQLTFTIDFFSLLLRPIILILIISLIASIYVVLVKTRIKESEIGIKSEFVPINEIREYCSLYDEKNALTLEIRQSEDDTRRKKMAKKTYKNILSKNTIKIEEIQKEIITFKKVLMESGETFENIVKKLDVLEAERISVKDSLVLLESRYKRGRLPSRAAYLKLSDDFKKRRKKIDRTIDKLIQQLRSYLI